MTPESDIQARIRAYFGESEPAPPVPTEPSESDPPPHTDAQLSKAASDVLLWFDRHEDTQCDKAAPARSASPLVSDDSDVSREVFDFFDRDLGQRN